MAFATWIRCSNYIHDDKAFIFNFDQKKKRNDNIAG